MMAIGKQTRSFIVKVTKTINFKLIEIVLFSKYPLNVTIDIICFNLLMNGFIRYLILNAI